MAERDPVRLFGEPLHPALVHVPLGALMLLPLWDALGVFHGAEHWWAVGFWTGAAAGAAALVAATIGFIDYTRLPEGPAESTGTRHMLLMLTAVAVLVLRLVLQGGPAAPDGGEMLLAISALSALVAMAGGFFGGRLVYTHGVGQRRVMP